MNIDLSTDEIEIILGWNNLADWSGRNDLTPEETNLVVRLIAARGDA